MTPGLLVDVLGGAVVTLEVAGGAWVLSVLLGLVLASARDLSGAAWSFPMVAALTTLRSVPQLVVLYIVYFGLGAVGLNVGSIAAAIISLGVTDAAFSAEYYRAGLMTVPASQRDAGLSLGMSSIGILRRIVLPQAIPVMIPPILNSFVGMLKSATLASAVGAPEILYRGQTDMSRTGQIALIALTIIVFYVVATIPLTRTVSVLERWIRSARAA